MYIIYASFQLATIERTLKAKQKKTRNEHCSIQIQNKGQYDILI